MKSTAFILVAGVAADGIFASAFTNDIGLSTSCRRGRIRSPTNYEYPLLCRSRSSVCQHIRGRLHMVRNVDLPEALVFYGLESIFEPPMKDDTSKDLDVLRLRPGISRILEECKEVGTAALILSEFSEMDEEELKKYFAASWESSSADATKDKLKSYVGESGDSVLSFRCINTKFTALPASEDNDDSDAEYIFYNLQSVGRSPSPAFLLDSLQSIQIDPRGFGGSSGFARSQWLELRRSPMTARTVVFVAGDWDIDGKSRDASSSIMPWLSNQNGEDATTTVHRCAAARAAGCRVVYL